MSKHRRSLRGASRSEMAARAAALEWMQKSLDKLKPDGDPETMLKIATAFSKMSMAQMKVRQVKGKEEDELPKGVEDKLDGLQKKLEEGLEVSETLEEILSEDTDDKR